MSEVDDSLRLIFPVSKLGLATYFLAAVYLWQTIASLRRVRKVTRFSRKWNFQKLLYLIVFSHTLIRTIAFGIISGVSLTAAASKFEDSNDGYPELIILFIFPEFVFLSSYLVLFFCWIEVFVFSHEQYFMRYSRFQKSWKTIFSLFNLAMGAAQIWAYVELYLPKSILKSDVLIIIYILLISNCLLLPCIVGVSWSYLQFMLSGFPYNSAVASMRVSKLNWILLIWSFGRIVRGLMLWIFNIDRNWGSAKGNLDLFSILVVTAISAAEVMPISMLMDWQVVSLLILGDRDVTAQERRFSLDFENGIVSIKSL
jgi:hypothetical protein